MAGLALFHSLEGLHGEGGADYICLRCRWDFSHTLKMIYGMEKDGKGWNTAREERHVGQCLGNKKEVGNEVGLSDSWVNCPWREDEVHKVQYAWMCAAQLYNYTLKCNLLSKNNHKEIYCICISILSCSWSLTTVMCVWSTERFQHKMCALAKEKGHSEHVCTSSGANEWMFK